jgi:tetratricopeptide (TPR) repeat protein
MERTHPETQFSVPLYDKRDNNRGVTLAIRQPTRVAILPDPPMNKFPIVKSMLGVCAVSAITTLSLFGAGSEKVPTPSPQAKQANPAIKAYNDGVDLMHAKQFAKAQAKFEEAVKLNPGFAEAHNNLAFTLRKGGSQNYQLSMDHYNKAIQLNPKLAEAYMYRGVLYAIMGRKADAQADLVVLQKLNPHYAKELDDFIKTGKENDELLGAAKKVSS